MSAPIDEMYTLDAQDPNDPVWESDAVIADMQGDAEDPTWESTPHVRTSGGVIDFLNDIKEEVEEWLDKDPGPSPKRQRMQTISTKETGSDKWRAARRTITPTMAAPVITNSDKRRRVTMVNYGPNTAYLSSIPTTAAAPNTIRLPVSGAALPWAPLVLQTQDDIWMVCAAGESAIVDLMEEFDYE